MITSKRRLHFRCWILVACLLPLILLGSFLAQQPETRSTIPESLVPERLLEGKPLAQGRLLNNRLSYQIRESDQGYFLELSRGKALKIPDVLIYLQEGDENEKLIGSITSLPFQQYPFQLSHGTSTGTLSLYSLGHQETIASVEFDLEASL